MCVIKQSIPPFSDIPYHFVETGINVYSFEELLFHCYHYWKESLADLAGGGVSNWVKGTLGLSFIGAQMERLFASGEPLSERFMTFLAMEGYFDDEDLSAVEHEITVWENKSELEKLKQQGDERLAENDYEKAAFYYEKLLTYGESAASFNNIGCCHMKMGRLQSAGEYLERAAALEPRNSRIKLNIAMLYLLQSREAEALNLLLDLEKTDNDRDVQYYLGDLELRRNNLKRAREYFLRSAKMGSTSDAYAALCKIALRSDDFEGARAQIEKIADKSSSQYLENLAVINYATGDKESALKNAESLLAEHFNKAGYWALAAKLYRETGNLEKAVYAIEKGMELDDSSDEVVFENARVKKALGKTLEYQTLLSKIVDNWSKRYKLRA